MVQISHSGNCCCLLFITVLSDPPCSYGKTWDGKKIPFGKIFFFYILTGNSFAIWAPYGNVYPFTLAKTMIVCRNNTRSEVIQMAKNFPFEVTRIFAHFQYNRRNDFRLSISADSRSCVEQIFQSFWAWLDHMDNRLAWQHLQSSTSIHSNN